LLALSLDSASKGGHVVVDLNFSSTAPAKTQPVGLEWALAFDAKSVANISVAPGAGAIAAGKSIACYFAAGTYTCVATGLNANPIPNGLIAQMTVSFSPSYAGLVSFGVIDTLGVTAAGATVPISGTGATIVVYALTSLACSPTTIPSASVTSCTVTMSPAAPRGGAKIWLASNSPLLVVPAAVNLPPGATTGSFSAHTGNIFVNRSATITAAYSGNSRSTAVSLGPARAHPQMITCSPNTVTAGTGTTCTLALSGEDQAGQVTVSGGPNLKVPPMITIRPGQASLRFRVFAEALSPRQTSSITVQDGNVSLSQAIGILPSPAPVLTFPPHRTAAFGQPVEFTVAAADPEGLSTMLSAAGLPKAATFDAASGRFAWTPDASQAGQFDVVFTATNSASASATGHALIEVGSGRPRITAVRNAASQDPAGCSPGAVATLTGNWLSASERTAADASGASTELAAARVSVNDVSVPVLAVSPERIDFFCPEAEPGIRLAVSVENEAGKSVAIQSVMQPARAGIFSRDRSGEGQGMVTFAGASLLAAARTHEGLGQPAQLGDVLTILTTGLDPAALLPLVRIGDIVIGARAVTPVPGQAGVYGVEILVPPGLPAGDVVPVTILPSTPDGTASNTVTLAVE
jgi:uncharacterized protein (TIGR03437 family)